MTDSPTPAQPGPVDPDVELASAHLDGEAGSDERARLDDPAVQAHLSAFAGLTEQVRDVPPPPAGLLDDQVARAMEAFDGDDRVVPLERRGRDQAWWQRIPLGAVAAALVVVALIGAVGLASTAGDDDAADMATSALDESTSDESSAAGAASEESDTMAGTMEDSAALESSEQFDDVGTPLYDSYDALADDLRAELGPLPDQPEGAGPVAESDAGTTAPEPGAEGDDGTGADPCDAVGQLGLDPASVVLVRPAVVSSAEVTVVVHDASDGRRLTVVEDATCTVVDDRAL